MLEQQFAPVVAELEIWRDRSLTLPLWWRDDDATAPSPSLDRLLALSSSFDAPVHLAVVPSRAQPALAQRLRAAKRAFAIPHGWRHENHAPPTEKKAEFGAHRPVAVMLSEVEQGWRRIEALFGPLALPVFVPPWNRACPAVVDQLADCGLTAFSAFQPRRERFAAPNVLQVNVHLDPISWRGGGGLMEPEALAVTIADHLRARRLGRADNLEPYGLLTHHLVHDEPSWTLVARLIEILMRSGVARWTSPIDDSPRPTACD
jgi:hypothetical protein